MSGSYPSIVVATGMGRIRWIRTGQIAGRCVVNGGQFQIY